MEVRVYETLSQLDELRASWVEMQSHPNSDYEHFRLVCELRRGSVNPFVLAVWEEERCRTLLVGRRESAGVSRSIGYFRSPTIRATVITTVYAGVLGQLDRDAAGLLVETLRAQLKRGNADVVVFNLLAEGDALWNTFPKRNLVRRHPGHWSLHRELSLKPTPGFLLREMRSKHRYWLKRKERELDATFPGKVRWIWWSNGVELGELCQKLERVAKQTYQRGLKAGFINDEETRARMDLFARRGQLRACVLEIDGVPKAYWLGEVYNGVFHSAATGYTSDVRQFEAGTLLLLRVVDELVKEGVGRLDFGLGDAQYKERFGDRSWREGTSCMYAPTAKGRLLQVFVEVCELLDRSLRGLLGRVGVVDRLKKGWRRQIGDSVSQEE